MLDNAHKITSVIQIFKLQGVLMKRAGFTMIELIFVIVILGILASVAVPKLLGVKNSAEEGIIKSFVGSLNTTVGPAKWSQSLMDGNNGSIKKSVKAAYDINTTDTDFPSGFAVQGGTSKCTTSGASVTPSNTTAVMSGKAGNTTFYILCVDGTSTTAPKFYYTSKTTSVKLSGTNLKL